MAKISVNNRQIKTASMGYDSFRDVVDYLTHGYLEPTEVITSVTLNGESFPMDEAILSQRFEGFDTANFQAKCGIDITFDAIDSSTSYIDTAISKILGLCEAYSRRDFQKADIIFMEITEILDLFVQLVSGIQRNLKLYMPTCFEKSNQVKNLEVHLLFIIKSLVTAREKNDFSMLCDLLEYELVDNLKKWKAVAMPHLKKLKTENR